MTLGVVIMQWPYLVPEVHCLAKVQAHFVTAALHEYSTLLLYTCWFRCIYVCVFGECVRKLFSVNAPKILN